MNMHQSSINTAPEATESDADRSETFTLTGEELSRLQPTEMRDLLDGLNLASESLCGLLNRPRCSTEDERGAVVYHPGAVIIEHLLDYIDVCTSMVFKAAENAQPKSVRELECKAWLALREEARFEENLSEFAAFATRITADVKHQSRALGAPQNLGMSVSEYAELLDLWRGLPSKEREALKKKLVAEFGDVTEGHAHDQ